MAEIAEIKIVCDKNLHTGWYASLSYEHGTSSGRWEKSFTGGFNIYSTFDRLNAMKHNKSPIRNIVLKVPYGKTERMRNALTRRGYEVV